MSSPAPERFTELLSGYLDGELTSAEEAELLGFLEDALCAAQFLEMTRVDRELVGLLATPIADDAMAALVRRDLDQPPDDAAAAGPAPVPALFSAAEARASRRARVFRYVAGRRWRFGLAAAILLAVGWLLSSLIGGRPQAFASLTEVRGIVFVLDGQEYRPARAGHALLAHQGIVTGEGGSVAIVEFIDGSRLELAAETTVSQLVDIGKRAAARGIPDKRIYLAQGALRVDAAKQPEGHPLVVATPQAEIVVLGTRFTLESEAGATQVEVAKGKVQFTRKVDNTSIEVPQGNFAIALPDAGRSGPEPLTAQPVPVGAVLDASRGLRLGHKGGTSSLAFTADGRRLASCMWSDGIVRVWDVSGPQQGPTEYLGQSGAAWTVAVSPDERTLASGGNNKTLCLWDVPSQKLLASFPHRDHLRAAVFSPDGTILATAGFDSAIRLREPRSGAERAVFPENDQGGWVGVFGLAISPDNRWLASALSNRLVRLRDLKTGAVCFTLMSHSDIVRSVAFSSRGNLLASASKHEVIVWDAQTGTERYRIDGANPVAFSPDGTVLAAGGPVPTLRAAATGKVLARIDGHRGGVYALAFAPNGKRLAIGSWYGITFLDLPELGE
jgi:hypothetical protein